MTKEEAKAEIRKVFEPAFANYIITALTEGATPSERKTGKWIPVTNGRGGSECNQCHSYAPSYQSGVENKSNYCPHCGAKMEGAEE